MVFDSVERAAAMTISAMLIGGFFLTERKATSLFLCALQNATKRAALLGTKGTYVQFQSFVLLWVVKDPI
jgi:hypothetical protein